MCGRFSLGVDTDRLIAEFDVTVVTGQHRPRYNVAPTQPVAAIVHGAGGTRLGSLRWGLVPAGPARPGGRPLINARAESVDRKPAFAESFRRRRCWVLADGFYEWRKEPRGSRSPFHIRLPDGRPFAFAGIWDRADGEEDGEPVVSCAILTTRPAAAIAGIHDRMPVILPPETRTTWLDPSAEHTALTALLRPYQGDLEVRRVSSRVNSTANDDPSCRHPIEAAPETSAQ